MIINMANNPCGSRNAFRKTNLDTVRIELEGETAVLGDSWKTDLIQELLSIGRTSVSIYIILYKNKQKCVIIVISTYNL